MTPMKGSFNPQKDHDPWVENHCSGLALSAGMPTRAGIYGLPTAAPLHHTMQALITEAGCLLGYITSTINSLESTQYKFCVVLFLLNKFLSIVQMERGDKVVTS